MDKCVYADACFQCGHSDLLVVLYRHSTAVLPSLYRRSTVFFNGLTALPRLSATVWKVFLIRTVDKGEWVEGIKYGDSSSTSFMVCVEEYN